jgi:hypothetical protein
MNSGEPPRKGTANFWLLGLSFFDSFLREDHLGKSLLLAYSIDLEVVSFDG